MSRTHSVTSDEAPTAVPLHAKRDARDIAMELAATAARIMDAKDERRQSSKRLNEEIKDLEKRQRELIGEIRADHSTQLEMFFGSKTEQAEA